MQDLFLKKMMNNSFQIRVDARKNKQKAPKKSRIRNYPLAVEKSYATAILKQTRSVNKDIKKAVAKYYVKIKQRAAKEFKGDAFEDDMAILIKEIGTSVTNNLETATLKKIARKHGISTSKANIAKIQAQFKSVGRVYVLPREKYLVGKVNVFTQQNVALIKDISQTTAKRVQNIVYKSVANGERASEVAKEIQKAFKVSINRSKLIARDQIGSLNSELNEIRMVDAGVDRWEWSDSGDGRVRSSHAALDGKVFSYKKPPAEGTPGSPIQCRCVALPIFDD